MLPTVTDVLRTIGDRGVLVGSARDGSFDHKDVDVVVSDDRTVFRDLLVQFGALCASSEVPGHLYVKTDPHVEVFEGKMAAVAVGRNKLRAYATLRRQSVKREIFGVVFRVWTGSV